MTKCKIWRFSLNSYQFLQIFNQILTISTNFINIINLKKFFAIIKFALWANFYFLFLLFNHKTSQIATFQHYRKKKNWKWENFIFIHRKSYFGSFLIKINRNQSKFMKILEIQIFQFLSKIAIWLVVYGGSRVERRWKKLYFAGFWKIGP